MSLSALMEPRVSPDRTLTLVADGGTLGGSPGSLGVYYSVAGSNGDHLHQRDTSGRRRHSDEAEYMALIAALRLLERTTRPGDRGRVVMDCQYVLRRIEARRTPKRARCRELFSEALRLIDRLTDRGVDMVFEWRARREVVEILGH